jgi:hypothetical protein
MGTLKSMDSVIVGGGLSGLLLAHRLHTQGHKITLLEARDHLGGSLRKPSLTFVPATSANVGLCEWLKGVSPAPLNFEITDHRPEIFDEAKWQAFSGFLDSQFPSLDVLAHLSHTHEIKFTPEADQIVRILIEQLPFEAQLKSEVTEIKMAGGCVAEVVVNGDKSVKCEQMFFTGAPGALNNLIKGEELPAKHRSRIAKFNTWTAVMLELNHAVPLTEPGGLRLFGGSTKEFEPVFGRIEGNISRWMTLAHSERFEEHEFTGQCIRHIKRQLKRAWPEAFEGKQDEKISVYPAALGQNSLKLKSPWLMPEIPNLFLACTTLATQSGFIGAIETVKGVVDLLTGAEFKGAPLEP